MPRSMKILSATCRYLQRFSVPTFAVNLSVNVIFGAHMMRTCFSLHSFCKLKYSWEKVFFNADEINFVVYAEQLLPHDIAILCCILSCGTVSARFIGWRNEQPKSTWYYSPFCLKQPRNEKGFFLLGASSVDRGPHEAANGCCTRLPHAFTIKEKIWSNALSLPMKHGCITTHRPQKSRPWFGNTQMRLRHTNSSASNDVDCVLGLSLRSLLGVPVLQKRRYCEQGLVFWYHIWRKGFRLLSRVVVVLHDNAMAYTADH